MARAIAGRSTIPTRRASSRGSGRRGVPTEAWVVRGTYGISQYVEGRREPAAAAESAVFLRVPGHLRHDDRARCADDGVSGPEAAGSAVGPGPRVGPQPQAAVHAAVEHFRRTAGHAGRCRPMPVTSATTRRISSRRSKATNPSWHRRSLDVGAAAEPAPAVRDRAAPDEHCRHHGPGPQRLPRPATESPAAQCQGRRVHGLLHA